MNIQLNFSLTSNNIATANTNTTDANGDDFDKDDYNFLTLPLLTQNFVASQTKIDPSIVTAVHGFPSPRITGTICYLNCGVLAHHNSGIFGQISS